MDQIVVAAVLVEYLSHKNGILVGKSKTKAGLEDLFVQGDRV